MHRGWVRAAFWDSCQGFNDRTYADLYINLVNEADHNYLCWLSPSIPKKSVV